MSGALAERAFATKLRKVGFADVWIGEKVPYGVAIETGRKKS